MTQRFEFNFRFLVGALCLFGLFVVLSLLLQPIPSAKAFKEDFPSSSTFEALGQSQQWLRLLHYGRNEFLLFSSRVNGSEFFISPGGANNPVAELKATFHAFEAEERGERLELGPLKLSAICAFPARRAFIERNFKVEFTQSPCNDYLEWKTGLAAKSVSMVFSSSFPGSPGSLFGHTLLKFGRLTSTQNADLEEFQSSELLDYSLSFAAFTGDANPFKYFAYGIFGGFQGEFGLAPFYLKVREYNHSEGRDLWIYDLSLNEEETNILIAHLWEVMNLAQFRYFFFDENCASMLIDLIEVAKPEWQLSDPFTYAVLPSNTLKALARQNGAIVNVRSRAALRQEFSEKLQSLSKIEQRQFNDAVNSMKVATGLERNVLQALVSYVELARMRNNGETSETMEKLRKASLMALSRLPPKLSFGFPANSAFNSDRTELEGGSIDASSLTPRRANVNAVEDPARGHLSSKFLLALFMNPNRNLHTETDHVAASDQKLPRNQGLKIGYRYGFHNLMDPLYGYEHGLGIEYFKLAFHADRNNFYIAEFTPVAIESLNQFTSLSRDPSYAIKLSYLSDNSRNDRIEASLGLGIAKRGRLFGFPQKKHTLENESTVYALCVGHASYAFAKSSDSGQTTQPYRERPQLNARHGLNTDLGIAAGYYQSFGWNGRFHLEAVPYVVSGLKAKIRLQVAPFFEPSVPLKAKKAAPPALAESTLAFHAELETTKPWRGEQANPITNIELGTSYFF